MAIKLSEIQKVHKKEKNEKFSLRSFFQTEISFGNSKLSSKKKEHFFSQIGILLDAGIDLKNALELFIEELKKDKALPIFQKINEDLINGTNIFDSMMSSRKFNQYDCYNIKIAEETGQISLIMNKLAQYYNRQLKNRRQIISSLIYPIMVIITAILAVTFMMKFIVPMFSNIYSRASMDLPEITKIVVNISNYFGQTVLAILILSFAFILVHLYFRNNKKYRRIVSNFYNMIPFIGSFTKVIYIEKLFNSLEILSYAKINITDALQLLCKMIGYYPLEVALSDIHQNILKGNLLHESFAQHKLFDRKVVSLIKIGEETNKLQNIFMKLSQQFANEIDTKLTVLQNLLEPILILIVGGLVGIILVSMYMPLFQMGNILY